MAFAITQSCCNDASCVAVCPVNCIHPTPDEPAFGHTDMLHVDPQTCIDCGACADACPVDAIFPVDQLLKSDHVYADINRQYYLEHPETNNEWAEPHFPEVLSPAAAALRIAVVGTGPSAAYTARALLMSTDAQVTMIDRLPVPGGLVRGGVAPDHPSTKKVGDTFAGLYRHPRLRMHMNVEVGKDITHNELLSHHHAVIYAVGAAVDRTLGIPGESKVNSTSATEFVAWYNAHPDVESAAIDLSAERAVIVGNGNVALDAARILVADPHHLATTDIADHALHALRESSIREVVLLGRRGPADAAYTRPEFRAMKSLSGVEVVVDDQAGVRDAVDCAEPDSKAALLKDLHFERVDWTAPVPESKRIVFRFFCSPVEVNGDTQVESVRVTTNPVGDDDSNFHAGETTVPAGLFLRAIGYRGSPIAELPFDATTATVPNVAGRVIDLDSGDPIAGTYVAGWIKRGPSGGIGANRVDAEQTVDSLMKDAADRLLPEPTGTAKQFDRMVRKHKPAAIGKRQMLAIDRAERLRGHRAGRPRVKFATVPDLLKAGRRRRHRH